MKKALIVGLNNYPGNELSWCDNDAIAVKELIETNGDGSPNFDVKLITGECDAFKFNRLINELFEGDSDIALLYFSGHGHDKDGGYLCTTDYSQINMGVRMDDIMRLAGASRCKNKVIILDCCFSAQMGESLLANNQSLLAEGVTIMAASRGWETAAENNEIEHGVFTSLLLQGLKGGAADLSGNITPASLYSFVDQSLGAWQQRPVFKTNISQFLPIRMIQAKVPKNQLRRLKDFFVNPTDIFKLDPSYEFTNSPDYKHDIIEPYAVKDNCETFKILQMYESVGIVEPVDSDHMYFAAMESKGCRLTALGLHYWQLTNDNRF